MNQETQPSPPRTFSITLPRQARWMVAGAFVGGLLLFGLTWLSGRDKEFFQADGQPEASQDVALAPLPAPLAAGGASHMPDPQPANAQTRPHLVEEPTPPPPAPVAEAPASTAAAVEPAAPPSSPATGGDSPPQRIAAQSPAPTYPASALRKGESGVVLLNVSVDPQGRPTRVRVAQRSGSRALDRAAIEAVQRWHFQPAMAAGQPVAGQVQVPIEFSR